MSYPFEDLHEDQFERLVVECARYLFGAGVQEFAKGPDGGRDARFHGVAERFPSTAGPWGGITVIQAKHTNALNAHFAEGSFSGAKKSSVLSEEIGRIKVLVDGNECDNYLLVSNRRLGGRTAPLITRRISNDAGLAMDRVSLMGVERLSSLLRERADLIKLAGITFPGGSLLVSSYEIAEIILAVGAGLADVEVAEELAVTSRVSYAEKNRSNQVGVDFAKELSDRYLSYTPAIDAFLADPMNADVKDLYDAAVEDFQLKILAAFDEHKSFERIFNVLVDALARRDGVLASNKKSLRALLFYMYWHCDIGRVAHARP